MTWPTAAASRIRVKVHDESDFYCRLFYNRTTGAVELASCTDDDVPTEQRAVYDDSDTNVEEDPAYQSYLATAEDAGRAVVDSFHPSDVIGANLSLEYNAGNPNTFHGMKSYASAKFNIYSYPKSGKRRKARHRHFTLDSRCCEDFADARLVIQSIQRISKLCNARSPMKCLVVLNPFSGGGGGRSKTGAKHVYATLVKPMLEQAGVEHDALVTARRGHAEERMQARESGGEDGKHDKEGALDSITTDLEIKDITEYDAIIAMGGDGILFELFQGIRARSDHAEVLSKMKFGKLACGTFNGLVKSVLHWSGAEYDHVESLMHICKGETSTLDIATYEVLSCKPPRVYTSFLTYAWGMIADCDYESECLRWLGPLRSDVWGVYRGLLCRKPYRARFSYLPPSAAEANGVMMPKLGEPLPEGWVTFDEEKFLVFWVCNTSHAACNMLTCPVAKMNDGLFHVLVVR